MISIIICSINKTYAQQVQKNIADTIGVVWEAIVIDNTITPKSLTHIYNLGAAKAQYDILCFVHEDIIFETANWGTILVDHFKDDLQLGLIGVAGSKYKSKTPSGWFTGITEMDCCNITHLNKNGEKQNIYFNPSPGSLSQQAIVLDGVFLCCPKKVWEEFKFDDILLRDFHLYDLDFSFRVAEKYKVIVIYNINVIHITKGAHYGNKWLESTLLWHKAMQKKTPSFISENDFNTSGYENRILRNWLIRLKHEDLNFYNKLNWLYSIKIWTHILSWPYVFLFLVKSIFKAKPVNNK